MILHIDMDAFYASVETRARPELSGQPIVVGGSPSGRGVVAAASYAAREYGIHSAMPMRVALRLCPDLVILPVRMQHYAEVSAQIRAIFQRYTPLIEPLALDEAFLDVAGSERLFGPAEAIGQRIKAEIAAELGLTASVGVAPNKFLAKLASDAEKPDGFVVIRPESVQWFLDPLPSERLWGVGDATKRRLSRLGIETVGQLRSYPRALIEQEMGEHGGHLWELAHGRDPRPVIPEREAKSLSREITFDSDISDRAALRAVLADLAQDVAFRLRRNRLQASGVFVKVRFHDFRTITRSCTLACQTDLTDEIRTTARALLEQAIPDPTASSPVRLVGLGLDRLDAGGTAEQGSLFEDERQQRSRALDRLSDELRGRFGAKASRRFSDSQDEEPV